MSFLKTLFGGKDATTPVVIAPVVTVDVNNDINSVINNSNELIVGENGSLEYSPDAISDKLVAMFFKMVRNTNETDVEVLFAANVAAMLAASLADRVIMATNLFLLCFLTRNCRGGKGEKTLFHKTFELLASKFPDTVHLTLSLIPLFGSWKDVFILIERNKLPKVTVEKLLDLVTDQLAKDYSSQHPTLLAKWMPREGKSLYTTVTEVLVNHGMKALAFEVMVRYNGGLNPNLSGKGSGKGSGKSKNTDIRKEYRKLIVLIASKLDLVETHMCEGTWETIEFSKVPSLAISQYAHAFDMSEQKKVHQDRSKPTEDRMICKEHYISHLIDGKVNGSQVSIDKLVESVFNLRKSGDLTLASLLNQGPYDMLLAHRQFESYVEYIQLQLTAALEEARVNLKTSSSSESESESESGSGSESGSKQFIFSPCDSEVMIDVSGSMSGQPMHAAIGIGMLIMALQKKEKPLSKSSFLTFHEKPSFVDITNCTSFPETVDMIRHSSWGGSTNFMAAFDLMLKKSGNNIANAKKTLIVLSDMQFNTAIGHEYHSFSTNTSQNKKVDRWETMYDTICQMWKNWYAVADDQLPTIVFWNLRGDTKGHPVKSSMKGVTEISGFSASLYKMVLFGEELAQTVDPETQEKVKPNPSQVLARTLCAKEYECVKEALGWKNGQLVECTFKEECALLV